MAAHLTPRELDIVAALWRRGSGTVGEVRDELDEELAYTTVLTVLRGLEQKGFVRHEQEGKAHRFFPEAQADEAAAGLLRRIVDKVYQGSPVRLVAHLVAERDLSQGELDEIAALLHEVPSRVEARGAPARGDARGGGRRAGKRR